MNLAATSQSTVALTVSMISFAGVVIAAIIGWFGVRRTSAPLMESNYRQERKDLLDRIDELEQKQDDDRQTIRQQGRLITQQEDRINNQGKTIDRQDRRIRRLEAIMRRHNIPIPNGDDTDPGAIITRQ